eukprot:scaffold48084_cov61-Attheya_sp.AAC.5
MQKKILIFVCDKFAKITSNIRAIILPVRHGVIVVRIIIVFERGNQPTKRSMFNVQIILRKCRAEHVELCAIAAPYNVTFTLRQVRTKQGKPTTDHTKDGWPDTVRRLINMDRQSLTAVMGVQEKGNASTPLISRHTKSPVATEGLHPFLRR